MFLIHLLHWLFRLRPLGGGGRLSGRLLNLAAHQDIPFVGRLPPGGSLRLLLRPPLPADAPSSPAHRYADTAEEKHGVPFSYAGIGDGPDWLSEPLSICCCSNCCPSASGSYR